MSIPFPTDEWIKAMMVDLNASKAYEDSAKTWEGDFLFVVQPGGNLTEEVKLYMDLWHGKCRDAYAVNNGADLKTAFVLSAPVSNWKKVMTKQLDPIQAMMTGQLRLKGNMAMIMNLAANPISFSSRLMI